jgi:hypothetical protein
MRHVVVVPLVILAALTLGGCQEKSVMTVAEFMENEVALYGTLGRCDQDPGSVDPAECSNARVAAERIAAIEERALRQAREQAFEAARAEYRARLDRERELRQQAEAEAQQARLQALIGPEAASAEDESEAAAAEEENEDGAPAD